MRKASLVLIFLSFWLCGYQVSNSEQNAAELRPHMRALYTSLMDIFPLVLVENAFPNRDNAAKIQMQLNAIAEHSKSIQKIAGQSEKGQAFLSKQLERNATQAALKFRSGYPEQAHFFVEELYDTCLSCHTSRASASDSKYTLNFGKDLNLEALGPFGKVKFYSLSRQFDKALAEYEEIFTKSGLSSEDLVHFDPLVDYLVLAVRVKSDVDRVIKTFSDLLKRPIAGMIRRDIEIWLSTLKKIKSKSPKDSKFQYARNLLQESKQVMEFPRDRGGIVYYIFASKYLKEALAESKLNDKEKAEAYYSLGICELGLGEPFLATESGMYLEEAIRLAPRANFARKAFGLFEQNLMYGYTGSSGTSLPPEEKAKLDELRKLVF